MRRVHGAEWEERKSIKNHVIDATCTSVVREAATVNGAKTVFRDFEDIFRLARHF